MANGALSSLADWKAILAMGAVALVTNGLQAGGWSWANAGTEDRLAALETQVAARETETEIVKEEGVHETTQLVQDYQRLVASLVKREQKLERELTLCSARNVATEP